MRTLILKLLLIVGPVGVGIGLLNFFVDPANVFAPPSYIGGVADILSQGHNVSNLSNYNERLLQEDMVRRLRRAPDVVVLGSSRVMEIGSGFFPDREVLNCGVSHGDINDVISIIGLLDSLHRLPSEFVIGVDHFLLGNGGTQEWESLYPYHQYFLRAVGLSGAGKEQQGDANSYRTINSLFSLNYFEASLNFMIHRHSKRYVDAGHSMPSGSGRLSDGTVWYAPDYRHPDIQKTAIDAKITGQKLGIPVLDPGKIRLFEAMIDFLQAKKVSLKFIMIPYHPEFYKAVKEGQAPELSAWDTLLRTTVAKKNIFLSGSFDADSIGMPVACFYDMYHCSGESIKKYIKVE